LVSAFAPIVINATTQVIEVEAIENENIEQNQKVESVVQE